MSGCRQKRSREARIVIMGRCRVRLHSAPHKVSISARGSVLDMQLVVVVRHCYGLTLTTGLARLQASTPLLKH